MASTISVLNTTNEVAYLTGIFNWQMSNASYTTPDGNSTISFHVVSSNPIPLSQYVDGAINTYNLIGNSLSNDANLNLFNTSLTAGNIRENITRKHAINRVPFANYDQLVDLGTGAQRIVFNVIFAGTMYQTALLNFTQTVFGSQSGTGTLTHPFYNSIENVLPIELSTLYTYDSLNCVVCEIIFLTSDLTHLVSNSITESITQTINKYYIGTQNAVTSMGGTISAINALSTQIGATL